MGGVFVMRQLAQDRMLGSSDSELCLVEMHQIAKANVAAAVIGAGAFGHGDPTGFAVELGEPRFDAADSLEIGAHRFAWPINRYRMEVR